MTATSILTELKKRGTDQNVKVYSRHGVGPNQYGVSFGDLKDLVKQVKRNHEAALELWQSGNHDARIFATMIADPSSATAELLDHWVEDLDNYVVTDSFSSFVVKTELAREKGEEWRRISEEWISTAGWSILSLLAMKRDETPDEYYAQHLSIVAAAIRTAPNRTRYAMNNALIAIGIRNENLRELATAAAEGIGKVEVDHGETGCKTPDALAYIERSWKRKLAM